MRHEFQAFVARAADGVPVCASRHTAAGPTARGTAVLVHGFGQNLLTWHARERSFCRYLAQLGWHVEVLELRGHGLSRARGGRYAESLGEHLTQDLPALMAGVLARRGPGPLVLVGHSMGGLLATWLATRYEAVDAVVTIASPGRMQVDHLANGAQMLPWMRRFMPGMRGLSRMPFYLDMVGQATAAMLRLGGESFMPRSKIPWRVGSMEPSLVLNRVTRGFDRTSFGVVMELLEWADTGRLRLPGVTEDLVAELSAVRRPVLLVSSPTDTVIRPEMALRPGALPGASVTELVVEGFGHCDIVLGRQAPVQVWESVGAWLDRLA